MAPGQAFFTLRTRRGCPVVPGRGRRFPDGSFIGLLNADAHIQAARELAEAKGARLPDIGSLKSGQFYVTNDRESFARVDTLYACPITAVR